MNDPVYILIRTSGRPRFFEGMMQSIEAQTYGNIVTIVHTDDPEDGYCHGDRVIRSVRNPAAGRGHFNLYCNRLLDAIPDEPGWYHFMDDDDMYASDDVIEMLAEHARRTHLNVGRVDRGGLILPTKWARSTTFQSECFFLHTDHRRKARWGNETRGDHHYSGQLSAQLPIHWIDGLVIAKAQDGKGWGSRLDLGEDRTIVLRGNEAIFDETNSLKSW